MSDLQTLDYSLILGRFHIENRIGQEGRCYRYILRDVCGGERGQIKVQKQGEPRPTILHQAGFLQEMQGYPGFPLMIWSGNFNNTEMCLITDKLGPALPELLPRDKKTFGLATTCLIATQIIKLVQILHDKHAVLTNFAPQNFRIDPRSVDKIVVSSLYNAKRFRSSRTMKHYKVKQTETTEFINHFVSLNRLANMTTSRRDDLESFFFLLVYLAKGSLPWSGISLKNVSRAQDKMFAMIEPIFVDETHKVRDELFQGLPREFQYIFDHICGLKFQERPNYSLIRMKLKKILLGLERDSQPRVEWITQLTQLRAKRLRPQQINFYTEKDKRILSLCYSPFEQKIELDKVDQTNGFSHHKQSAEVVKRKDRKGTCVLM